MLLVYYGGMRKQEIVFVQLARVYNILLQYIAQELTYYRKWEW